LEVIAAEVRNRALRPLEADPPVHFDKLLFINDVMFNPVDAKLIVSSRELTMMSNGSLAQDAFVEAECSLY
jgi:hypothetical protein